MAVPYTFSTATGSLPLSQLDSNFATGITIGNTTVVLGDSISTINNLVLANVAITSVGTQFPNGYLANSNVIVGTTTLTLGSTVTTVDGLTLSNVTISSGNVTITNVSVTTANATTANVGTLIVRANATVGGNVSVTGNVSMNVATITTANVTTANTSSLVVTGNQTFVGTGNRILGDFSNATVANRVAFQTSTTNSNTGLVVLPNGTATTSNIQFFNNSDSTNASGLQIANLSTESTIRSLITGTGTYLPITVQTGGSERMRLDTSGNVGIGTSSAITRFQVGGGGGGAGWAWFNQNVAGGTPQASMNTGLAIGGNYSAGGSEGNIVYGTYLTIAKWDGTTYSERMRIDSSGNVGIGTTSPRSAAGYTSLGLNNATTGAFIDFSVAGTRQATITGSATVFDFQSALTSPITFSTNGANERMRIDSAGNLQISAGAVVLYAPAPAAISAAATLTNANIQGQIISATGTTYTITMPLGTTMETLVTWATTNIAYDFFVINTATGIITMAVNTGVTSLGSLTVAIGASAHFRIRRTAANTFVLYRLS